MEVSRIIKKKWGTGNFVHDISGKISNENETLVPELLAVSFTLNY